MTSPSMGRLLISHITLRGPELRQLYDCIASAPGLQYGELARLTAAPASDGDPFGLQEAALREALNFLLVARLIEQQGAPRRQATFRAIHEPLQLSRPQVSPSPEWQAAHGSSTFQHAPFTLLLMRQLTAHPDERQRAIATLYRQFVRLDILALPASALRDEAERGALGTLFAWTGEKIGFWARLCDHMGLTRGSARDSLVMFTPRPELVISALRLHLNTGQEEALAPILHDLDANYFACFTARGTVHRGLAQTVVALHRLGAIRLSHSSDAAQSLVLGEWRVSDVELLAQHEDPI